MSRTILLVDDEDDIREVAAMSLEMVGGWEVVPARSGFEALDLARSRRPAAILMDVMMPELDGPTTVRRLQADPETRSIPVILLTAKVQPADRQRLAALGVRGVIAKPFDPMTLPAEVEAQLRGEP